ncbi:MAG: DMT family transporter [Clostridia bacterium]|nr:DMT family transporter [Clostridia bacterium]
MSLKKTLLGSTMLLLAAFFWGSTFVAQSSAAVKIAPFGYLFARSLVGALALFLVVLLRMALAARKKGKDTEKPKPLFTKKALVGGILCGVALTVASAFQQYGIHLGASAGEAGFLTAIYMFIVPLLSFVIYRKRPSINVLAGAILTAVGLYFLCIKGQEGGPFGIGQGLLLCCAFFYAVHILVIDRFEEVDGMVLSAIQFATCGLLSLPISLLFEHPSPSDFKLAWFPILYAGIFSSAIAYTLQIYGQKCAPPALTSVLMSTESVIALLAEWACAAIGIFGTPFSLSFDQILGCVLAFVGIVTAQLVFKGKKKEKATS